MEDEKALTEEIVALAGQFGRYGCRIITALLRHRGWHVNHKRAEKIWRREGLKVPVKQPKRGRLWSDDGSCVRLRPAWKDHVWACDFVHLRLYDGKEVRLLTVIDEYSSECLAIRPAHSIRSAGVMEVLAGLMVFRGVPDHIRSDNGPEFTSRAVREWLGRVGARTLYIEPGSPWENGCEFQREVKGRTAGQGGLLYVAGGACADGALQADLQPGQASQLAGLPAVGA